MSFTLTSSAFNEGGIIPAKYTCEGSDISPPLAWPGAPEGTRSFALILDDPDAPMGTWTHWAAYNIPATTHALDEGFSNQAEKGAVRQAVTDFKRSGYGGPCPPQGHGPHHYNFRIHALDTQALELPEAATVVEVEKAARPHILATARLTGLYER